MCAWSRKSSEDRVREALKNLPSVEVVELTREIDLTTVDLPLSKAYRVHGVHTYIDIVNADELLNTDSSESERSHKRFLRYLNVLQRVLHTAILSATDVYRVDAQNHRTHLIVYKPYDSEKKRAAVSVAAADAFRQVLDGANELHEEFDGARIKIGIESGVALAVRNGTRGDRELLFLGNPANHAAKLLGGVRQGIYLGGVARDALGKDFYSSDPYKEVLTPDQILKCVDLAGLDLNVGSMLASWKSEVAQNVLSDISFSRPTPPLCDLIVEDLTLSNSRRIEAATIMADVDGFTKYVAERASDSRASETVRVLHVIRKELRDVLRDFGGKKIRYIGDCIQGVLAEGEYSTDFALTVEQASWCVAAMRDAIDVIHKQMPESASLGLGIGFDVGPVAITRVGIRGKRSPCIAGNAMLLAQGEQESCSGDETSIGEKALNYASEEIKSVFAHSRKIKNLTTNMLDDLIETQRASPENSSEKSKQDYAMPRAHAAKNG